MPTLRVHLLRSGPRTARRVVGLAVGPLRALAVPIEPFAAHVQQCWR